MAVSAIVQDGPYFTSGEIRFSSLRSTFSPALASNNIRASTYRRTTSLTKVPIVPDAVENDDISTSTNLKISQFRGSILSVRRTQTGTDTNLRIDNLWSGNESRNIPKYFDLNGTVGGTSTGVDAALMIGTSAGQVSLFNMKLTINGSVLGRGGGAAPGGVGYSAVSGNPGRLSGSRGNSGGNAIYTNISQVTAVFDNINGISTRNYPVDIVNNGLIYSGAGGGGGGHSGANGSSGVRCYYFYYYYTDYACGVYPSCGGNTAITYEYGGGCNCGKKGCYSALYRTLCRADIYYETRGGYGGSGGTGAPGRGYNYSSSLAGGGGTGGEGAYCSDPNLQYAGGGIFETGQTGYTGGNGGDWGESGKSPSAYPTNTNPAPGGSAGRSILSFRTDTTTLAGATGINNIKGSVFQVISR